MAISFDQFVKNYPVGSQVLNPEGAFLGECVSYVRKKMLQVDGVITGPLGNAVDFATNPTFLKFYEKVSSPQNGDIMIWGKGQLTGVEGHDGLYLDAQIINQNYDGSRRVSINPMFTSGFIGYFRLKGEDQMTTEDQVREHILGVTGGIMPKDQYEKEVKYWTGRTHDEFAKYCYRLGDDFVLNLKKQLEAKASILPKGMYLVP